VESLRPCCCAADNVRFAAENLYFDILLKAMIDETEMNGMTGTGMQLA
jgi:hypothetical protein